MTKILLLLLAALALFLFSAGAFDAEFTLRGPGVGGCIAVGVGQRTITLVAKKFRHNRSYYLLRVR